jgi:agmatinase
MDHRINPFRDWAAVTDCGDIQNTPFDKLQALQELERGWNAINAQSPKNKTAMDAVRIISIGGDHTISESAHPFLFMPITDSVGLALPILRALHSTWGRVAVLHFDSHLDTW